jgi:hypothetical protein
MAFTGSDRDRQAVRFARSAAEAGEGEPREKLAQVLYQASGYVDCWGHPLEPRPEVRDYFLDKADEILDMERRRRSADYL